ncbi:MAG: hypothetical protein AVDCRST_MAG68-5077 [uncultured Gemmatimonadetes bacterium]|uniref:Uncharacterized protein n=1 Tax=uncultured Gemmatimonadota bacterium TaxID=203437 RepID=A0A6J4MP03_9BACT|nr:MAG: hypothetical protein AVDCRST_MAG68-5077 [uncultured Gemmatimonadota bacterium]
MTQTATDARQLAEDLRASVRDFRDPNSTERERQAVLQWWDSLDFHVPNQFAAMLRAAELEAGQAPKPRKP